MKKETKNERGRKGKGLLSLKRKLIKETLSLEGAFGWDEKPAQARLVNK